MFVTFSRTPAAKPTFFTFTLAVLISYVVVYLRASRSVEGSMEKVLAQDFRAEQSK